MTNDTKISVFPNTKDLFQFAADHFEHRASAAINNKGTFSVVLAGGTTPMSFFDRLASIASYKKNIPWQQIKFFFGDERYVPSNDIKSNFHMAKEHLFSKVPINPENIYPISTAFKDPKEAAKDYELTLIKVFQTKEHTLSPFDLVYLGLGEDAHTASLMPYSDVVKRSINGQENKLVDSLFIEKTNMYRITLTPHAINNSDAIIFMVTGANKAMAVANVLQGKRDTLQYPAQLIKSVAGKIIWYLDQEAADKLT